MATAVRLDWPSIVSHAAGIVGAYDTGVTLRQLFYRLVSDGTLPNTNGAYKGLSRTTAQARRDGDFPDLIDLTRTIQRPLSFDDAGEALEWLLRRFRLDRTQGQDVSLYLGIEKRGIVEQLKSWFWEMGLPILPLGGYSSQTFADVVHADANGGRRRAVLIYAGDFDPSGEDIDRDFIARSGCFDEVVRVALTSEQVEHFNLPPNPGKETDSRAAAFVARHGRLVQVEVDALEPTLLRALYQEAIDRFWDTSAFDDLMELEASEKEILEEAA